MTQSSGEDRGGRVLATVPADSYAHRLMLARAHAGHLSIRTAAERCGLNHASWANWERGMRSRTMVEDATLIAAGLGVDRDWLLHGGPLTRQVTTRRGFVRDNNGYARRRRVARNALDDRVTRQRRPKRIDHRVAA